MERSYITDIVKAAAFHGRILLKGFARTVFGSAVAGLIGLSAYGFMIIPQEGGYIAVCEFMVAIATTVVALCGMYTMGGKSRKKGGYER
jgi:hypothetical protein